MTHPSKTTPDEEPGEAITVSCPSCGWTHRTSYLQVAERLRAYHRCARYVPAKTGR